MGKRGARSDGPIGWPVPGCKGGGSVIPAAGRSALMLYQWVGISRSDNTIFVKSLMGFLQVGK